jgi:hypothetical protein
MPAPTQLPGAGRSRIGQRLLKPVPITPQPVEKWPTESQIPSFLRRLQLVATTFLEGILAAAQDVADRIFAKLGVRTRTAAARAAIANELVDPTPPPLS